MADYKFVQGDTGSKLRVTCKDAASGAVINLTNYTAKLRWKVGLTGEVVEKNMTIASAANGIVEYQFGADELSPPRMIFEVELTDGTLPTGKTVSSLELFEAEVREQLG